MPLLTARPYTSQYTQADLPATASAVRSATWDQALSDLPGASLVRSFDLSFARSITAAEKYSPAEASYFMEEQGLKDEFSFDRDYNELELNLLASRKRKEVARREVLARADGSGSTAGGRFAIALASNLLDPLAIGSAFVPVIGEARYASLLASAGGALGRAGVRAAVGAVEGVAGALLVEPLIAGAKIQEQADYRFADSFLNVTIGGVFGGGLHVAGGLVRDALKPKPLPSRALPDEAERIIARDPAAPDVGPLSGPLDVPDQYRDAAIRLRSAIYRARDVDLADPAAVSRVAGRPVLSVSQFVRESGGIIDDGGELSARDVTSRSMPGLVRKKGTAGADMDGVREKLFDAGYFPDKSDYNAISDSDIYDALANDLAGERLYPSSAMDVVTRIQEEREFVSRLESQGITRDMEVDAIAGRLRDLDDESRGFEPQESDPSHFEEYEQLSALDQVEAADLPTREAAMRAAVAHAVSGEAIEVRPIFDRSAMLEAARRIGDPDELPLSDPRAVDRANEVIAGGEQSELAAVQERLAELDAHLKALQDEAGLDADEAVELAAVVRGEVEAAVQAGKDAKELGRVAQMVVACALRYAG